MAKFCLGLMLCLALNITVKAGYWDCYNQKCEGTGNYYGTYIPCNNEYNYCSISGYPSYGYPTCIYNSDGGAGVSCWGWSYYCRSYSYDGEAYCSINPTVTISSTVTSFIVLMIIIFCCCRCCRRRGYNNQQTVIVRAAPAVQPAVVQNINVVPRPPLPPPAPAPQPYYPQQGYQNPGYPQQGYQQPPQGYYNQPQGGPQGTYQQQGYDQPPPYNYNTNAPPSPPQNKFASNPNFKE